MRQTAVGRQREALVCCDRAKRPLLGTFSVEFSCKDLPSILTSPVISNVKERFLFAR